MQSVSTASSSSILNISQTRILFKPSSIRFSSKAEQRSFPARKFSKQTELLDQNPKLVIVQKPEVYKDSYYLSCGVYNLIVRICTIFWVPRFDVVTVCWRKLPPIFSYFESILSCGRRSSSY